jgi:hypothetical protein
VGQGYEEPYDDLPPLRDVVIPDDARELEADRLAWLREQRNHDRQERHERLLERLFPHGGSQLGLGAPLLALAMFAVAAAGMLSVMLTSRTTPPRQAASVLASPAVPAGTVGGLAPALSLSGPRGDVALRQLRPAALAVVPPDCECELTLERAFRQAAEYGVDLVLLGRPEQADALRVLASGTGNGTVAALTGDLHALSGYAPAGLTLLLVRADGVVTTVVRNVGPELHAELELAALRDLPTWSQG